MLHPIARQALGRPDAAVLDWHVRPLLGGASQHVGVGFGVFRVHGTARDRSHELPWAAVAKLCGPSTIAAYSLPSSVNYWKRELLAYESGLLAQLPGHVAAPRCYGIQALREGRFCIWLEEIDNGGRYWSISQHHIVARHLGHFNGAYLAGYPLPHLTPWMLADRREQWVHHWPPDAERLRQFADTDAGRWLTDRSIMRVRRLWDAAPEVLAVLDKAPRCLCHNDAFCRNLMLRQADHRSFETIAVDWAYAGIGAIGQEIGAATTVALSFVDVAASAARDLDEAVFSGYCDGLRDAGWHGDVRLARFGYAATAALFGALFWNFWSSLTTHRAHCSLVAETITGHAVDEVIAHRALCTDLLLDLGDETLELLPYAKARVG